MWAGCNIVPAWVKVCHREFGIVMPVRMPHQVRNICDSAPLALLGANRLNHHMKQQKTAGGVVVPCSDAETKELRINDFCCERAIAIQRRVLDAVDGLMIGDALEILMRSKAELLFHAGVRSGSEFFRRYEARRGLARYLEFLENKRPARRC